MRDKLADIGAEMDKVISREANIRAGYIYVVSNLGAFGEDMVKVGMTRRLDPMDRVRELGDASVPFKFDVHAIIFSDDAVGLENKLHTALADRRVNRVNLKREFFRASPTEVRDVLAELAGTHLLEYTEFAEASEWRASGDSPPQAEPEARSGSTRTRLHQQRGVRLGGPLPRRRPGCQWT